MSKGNKESKKPKQVAPVVKVPVAGAATPAPASGAKPAQRKK